MIEIEYQNLVDAINSTNSMAEAALKLNLSFTTFKRKAQKLGLYKPNQGRNGLKALNYKNKKTIPLEDILSGKYPNYSRTNLKRRLFSAGIKENKCEICKITEWNNKKINCELDHINGINNDNRLENLRIICPNCHSQTITNSGKNKRKKK